MNDRSDEERIAFPAVPMRAQKARSWVEWAIVSIFFAFMIWFAITYGVGAG